VRRTRTRGPSAKIGLDDDAVLAAIDAGDGARAVAANIGIVSKARNSGAKVCVAFDVFPFGTHWQTGVPSVRNQKKNDEKNENVLV